MTQLIEKKKAPEVAGQEEVAAIEVFGREREQQIDNGKHKEIMLEEGDIPAGSGLRNWQRRSPFPPQYPEFSHPRVGDQRLQWQQGVAEPVFSGGPEDRLEHRHRFPANQHLRRQFPDDRGPRMEQQGDDQLAIVTRSVRIEFPKFDGTDPTGWIYKANKFFHFYKTSYHQKLQLASIHMKGKALFWYQDMDMYGFIPNWHILTQVMLERFGPSAYDDPMEALTRSKQTTSVEDYKERFEAISDRVRGIDDNNRLSCFLSGLKDEIRLPVRMFKPQSLLVAYGLAMVQEEHVLTGRRYRGSNMNFSNSGSPKFGGGNNQQLSIGGPKANVPVQKISQAQMEER
jgi:hypothetical protein